MPYCNRHLVVDVDTTCQCMCTQVYCSYIYTVSIASDVDNMNDDDENVYLTAAAIVHIT